MLRDLLIMESQDNVLPDPFRRSLHDRATVRLLGQFAQSVAKALLNLLSDFDLFGEIRIVR